MCSKCPYEITLDSNHVIQKSCQKDNRNPCLGSVQTIIPGFLKFKEREKDAGNSFMSLTFLFLNKGLLNTRKDE